MPTGRSWPSTTARGYECGGPLSDNAQKVVLPFVDAVLERLPIPFEAIRTDNGAEFPSGFRGHVGDRRVRLPEMTPATPRVDKPGTEQTLTAR